MAARFSFTLQPLLDAREGAEREKWRAFSDCRIAADECRLKLDRLVQARRHCANVLAEAGRCGAARDARFFDARLRSLESSVERERLRQADLEAVCACARDELATARRERRVIERLKERARQSFERAAAARRAGDRRGQRPRGVLRTTVNAIAAVPAHFWSEYVAKLAIVALVLAVLYLIGRAMKRMRPFGGGSGLELLESLALSPHAALHLVRVGRRYFLIGSGSELGVLAELAAPDAGAVDELRR